MTIRYWAAPTQQGEEKRNENQNQNENNDLKKKKKMWGATKKTHTTINAILLALCGMQCLYSICPIGEVVPLPGKNPYTKPSIRRRRCAGLGCPTGLPVPGRGRFGIPATIRVSCASRPILCLLPRKPIKTKGSVKRKKKESGR